MPVAFDIRVPAPPQRVFAALEQSTNLRDDTILSPPSFQADVPVSFGPRKLVAVARGSIDVGRDGSTHIRGHLSLPDPDHTVRAVLAPAAVASLAWGAATLSPVFGALGVAFGVAAAVSPLVKPSEQRAVSELKRIVGDAAPCEEPASCERPPQLCACRA